MVVPVTDRNLHEVNAVDVHRRERRLLCRGEMTREPIEQLTGGSNQHLVFAHLELAMRCVVGQRSEPSGEIM
jgi:hypothetical protein